MRARKRPARWPASDGGAPGSGLVDRRFRLQNLAAAIHAAFEVDVVRTAQFARILVLDIGRRFEGVGGAAHAAARRRGFASGNCHGFKDSGRTAAAIEDARAKKERGSYTQSKRNASPFGERKSAGGPCPLSI